MMSDALLNNHLQLLLLSLVPGLPLLVGFACLMKPFRKIALWLAPYSALPALAAALFLESDVNLEVAWFFMGGRMGLDFVGRQFLLLASLVWFISCLFGQSYLLKDPRRDRFFFFYLITMAFNFGLILAQDMLGFYLFFGLMSFSAYGLIVHTKSKEARQAGMVYIILVMVGEVLLFSGMLLMASNLPDLELSTIAGSSPATLSLILLFLGFAVKAGALPLHVWLPLAHPVAPVPASAVLSGVMIKAGLLGWLRFLPVNLDLALPGWGGVFIVLGFLAAFYGVVVGLCQYEVKTILAYSSISQMGLMTAMIGCGLVAPQLWPQVLVAVCLYALHHGLAKASLFLGTGVVKVWPASRSYWLFVALMALPCLALAGFPLTSGALAKLSVKEISSALPVLWLPVFKILLPLSALATTLLLYHFLCEMLSLKKGSDDSSCLTTVIVWLFSVAALLGVLVLAPTENGLRKISLLGPHIIWQGFWPVALGVGVMMFYKRFQRERIFFSIPAGDILWPFYNYGSLFFNLWKERKGRSKSIDANELKPEKRHRLGLINKGRRMEKRMMRWVVVGMCYLLLSFILFFLAAKG